MNQRDRRFLTHLTWSGAVVLVAAIALGAWAGLPFVKYLLTPQQHIVLQLETTKDVPAITSAVAGHVVAVMQRRIAGLGLAGASIAVVPGDHIAVDVRAPAASAAKLRTVLAERGVVEFKICPGKVRSYAGCGAVVATGADIRSARAGMDFRNDPEVVFYTKKPANFERLTRENIGQWMAIFLDGTSISGGTIEGVITGSGVIHGRTLTKEKLAALADELNAGTLPVPVRIVEPT